MLLNIQKTQHFPMYIFPLLILKPKIYYKWSIFTNDDQIWEDKWKVKIVFPTSIREVNRLKILKNWDEWYKLRRRFLITRFLAIKLWARISLQIGDNTSILFPYLFVNFHKINLLACVLRSNFSWPAFCAVSSTVTIDFKLTGIKVESSETYLLTLEKNLSLGSVSKLLTFFAKIRF